MPRHIQPIETPAATHLKALSELGQVIRAQRLQLGLRIDDAADMCGVPASLLSALENGTRSVGMESVLRVCDELGLALVLIQKSRWPAVRAAVEG